MKSFQNFCEDMDNMLMSSGDESKSLQVLRMGVDTNKNRNFWEDFINICSNRDGLGELLGVPPEKIAVWSSRIRDGLDKLKKLDNQQPSKLKEKKQMLPTGMNGALTMQKMSNEF